MSFLGNIVGSIGDGKVPPPPPQSLGKATITSAVRANLATTKPTSRPSTPSQTSGVKRKADDSTTNSNQRPSKPLPTASNSSALRRPAAPPLNAPRPLADKASVSKIQTDSSIKIDPSKPSPIAGTSSVKPAPSKGSFADLMARAKAQNPHQKIGVITHTKSTPKEKLSKRAEQKKAKEDQTRKDKSGNTGVQKPDSRRSISPVKNGVQEGRVSKASSKPGYKGTMGISTVRKGPRPQKASRYDAYLGTDEEDNSDVDEEDGYDEGGYESSDMEGGFDELEEEETKALRNAKADDAAELAYENKLREEKRKRLMALANKRR